MFVVQAFTSLCNLNFAEFQTRAVFKIEEEDGGSETREAPISLSFFRFAIFAPQFYVSRFKENVRIARDDEDRRRRCAVEARSRTRTRRRVPRAPVQITLNIASERLRRSVAPRSRSAIFGRARPSSAAADRTDRGARRPVAEARSLTRSLTVHRAGRWRSASSLLLADRNISNYTALSDFESIVK